MSANEVNDIVMRLLAAADHIRGREREEILHHVGRLSRAAVRERTAAVDEMQKLRKKIVQQSAELKRIGNASNSFPAAPSTQASKVSQPPASPSTIVRVRESLTAEPYPQGGGVALFIESRLQTLASDSTPALDYGPDHGPLSRPEGLPQPARKATAAETGSLLSRGEQRSPMGISSSGYSKDSSIQEQPGYGQFNQARFLALQAAPLVTTSSENAEERSSLQEGPAQPVYKVTAANAEPVAPRSKNRSESLEGPSSTRQAVDQLLDEIRMSQPVSAGQKRRASDGDLTAATAAKKQLMTGAPNTGADATNTMVATSHAISGVTYAAPAFQTKSAIYHTTARGFGRPTCTNCFQNQVPNCDGKAHCNQGGSHKCYYVLCDPATCRGAACVKIHSSQYDLKARKSGQVRRLVIGDSESVPPGHWDKFGHGRAVAGMDNPTVVVQQSFAGLPAPTQDIYRMPQGHVKRLGPGNEGRRPLPEAGTYATPSSRSAWKFEPTRPSPASDARGIKVETSDN